MPWPLLGTIGTSLARLGASAVTGTITGARSGAYLAARAVNTATNAAAASRIAAPQVASSIGNAGSLALAPVGAINSFGRSLDESREIIQRWADRLSHSSDSIKLYSAQAAQANFELEYNRRVRQFERGSVVGGSAAFSTRATDRLESHTAKLLQLLENIWNLLYGTIANAISSVWEALNIDMILDALDRKMREWFPFIGQRQPPSQLPFIQMFEHILNARPFPGPIPPRPAGAGP